ncbi:MAG: hypothetical protein A2015_09105 [Spirochaetes bacterium GWF1_31_7]|nr:MAG: hypothetical protein A2Y30_09115 [Spirochaetes bacterium GWE1_32_154]OHD44855.1 MAG: hypothetical protein A2Y29_09265 [Spirochaetes bacterium GWE2_31_10]OHD47646.1 MAG: hypothetical protein A2015_09105 [Spirochaetes bacterium GWF1_31_7]HBD94423.1 hypothetical protein [Spirochaetia bacterium]HBI37668.1 hypothetical protein [Spirochaetia bacterium]
MNLEDAIKLYEKNITKLAEKNGVEYEVMLENWIQKFNEFDKITDKKGFSDELESYNLEEKLSLVALTINGSILIVSESNDNDERKVRYQSIKIRTDDSKNVPEVFTGKIKDAIKISKTVVFENIIETSPIIKIKSSDDFNWDEFENVADEMTREFTKQFEMIDNQTITRRLNNLEL